MRLQGQDSTRADTDFEFFRNFRACANSGAGEWQNRAEQQKQQLQRIRAAAAKSQQGRSRTEEGRRGAEQQQTRPRRGAEHLSLSSPPRRRLPQIPTVTWACCIRPPAPPLPPRRIQPPQHAQFAGPTQPHTPDPCADTPPLCTPILQARHNHGRGHALRRASCLGVVVAGSSAPLGPPPAERPPVGPGGGARHVPRSAAGGRPAPLALPLRAWALVSVCSPGVPEQELEVLEPPAPWHQSLLWCQLLLGAFSFSSFHQGALAHCAWAPVHCSPSAQRLRLPHSRYLGYLLCSGASCVCGECLSTDGRFLGGTYERGPRSRSVSGEEVYQEQKCTRKTSVLYMRRACGVLYSSLLGLRHSLVYRSQNVLFKSRLAGRPLWRGSLTGLPFQGALRSPVFLCKRT